MNQSQDSTRVNYRIVMVLTLVHFTGDFYSSFFTPLLPAFVDKLGLTLAQVGLITGLVRFLSFMIQPAVGYMADISAVLCLYSSGLPDIHCQISEH